MSQLHISDVWQPDAVKRSRRARLGGVIRLTLKQLRHRFIESLLILLGIALGVGVVTGTETFLRYIFALQRNVYAQNVTTVAVRPQRIDTSELYSSGGVPAIRIAGPLAEPVELTVDHMLRAREDVPSVAYVDTYAVDSFGGSVVAVDGEPWKPPAAAAGTVEGEADSGTSMPDPMLDMPPHLHVSGTTPDGMFLKNRSLLAGRWLTWDDYTSGRPVLVLEETDVPKLFPDLEPEEVIGRTVTVTTYSSQGPVDVTWQIVGVLQQQELPGLYVSPSYLVEAFGPHTVNSDGPVRVIEINFAPAEPDGFEALIADLEVYFASVFGDGRVEVTNPMDMLAELERLSRNLSIALMGLSGLTLFVAAINILNLFTARVIRRRRFAAMTVALGAERRTLFNQILAEALILGLIGSAVGLAIARVVVHALANVNYLDGEIALTAVDVGFGLLAGVVFSVLFSLYPAYLSSSMEPADGLRTE